MLSTCRSMMLTLYNCTTVLISTSNVRVLFTFRMHCPLESIVFDASNMIAALSRMVLVLPRAIKRHKIIEWIKKLLRSNDRPKHIQQQYEQLPHTSSSEYNRHKRNNMWYRLGSSNFLRLLLHLKKLCELHGKHFWKSLFPYNSLPFEIVRARWPSVVDFAFIASNIQWQPSPYPMSRWPCYAI